MRLPRAVLAAGLLLAAAPAGGAAQQRMALTLETGTQVRVETRAAPGERLVGRVLASTPDSLSLLPRRDAPPVALHYPDLLSLEVRGGEDRRRGFLIGAGVGAGIAVVFGGIDAAGGEMTAGDVASIAIGNALIGGLVGYAFAPKGWQRLPLSAATRPVQAPPEPTPPPRTWADGAPAPARRPAHSPSSSRARASVSRSSTSRMASMSGSPAVYRAP